MPPSLNPAPDAQPQKEQTRKRKSHTKSRKGCGNCKLRRVKCDEARPQCQKCVNYGVTCNYDGDASDELQLPGEGAFRFVSISSPGMNVASTKRDFLKDSMSPEDHDENLKVDKMLGMRLALHDSSSEGEVYCMTQEDVDFIRMFKERTVFTVGTAQTVLVYRSEVINLVSSDFPYLTHVVLALTIMYDRCTSNPDSNRPGPSAKESFHLYHGSGIFNRVLSQPLKDEDRDALWGTAALLGVTTIASIEVTTAQEAWPLSIPESSDLAWLRMSDGKKEVWKLVDPLRPGSIWKDVLDYANQQDPVPYSHAVPELDFLYPNLMSIYSYDPDPSADKDDPYHTAASILVRLLELDCNHSTIMYFLSFLGHMDPRFRQLLHEKDAKAMLLLSWWYGKMMQYNVWWMARRMKLEGQAICLYLEQNHSDDPSIVRLLDYPKMMTGLVAS